MGNSPTIANYIAHHISCETSYRPNFPIEASPAHAIPYSLLLLQIQEVEAIEKMVDGKFWAS